jgi:protein gp37
MAETTGISWCDSTWNPWRGCVKVSEGCRNCYADTASKRNPGTLGLWGPPGVGSRVVGAESYWTQPAKWNRKAAASGEPRRVFCASLADVFEDWPGVMVDTEGTVIWKCESCDHTLKSSADRRCDCKADTHRGLSEYRRLTMDDVRRRVFAVLDATPHLTWLLLTKRPENIRRMVPPHWLEPGRWPAHVWPGTTTEDQANADRRVPELLKVPAAVRWLSVEPQLGPVELGPWLDSEYDRYARDDRFGIPATASRAKVGWVIVGCESGPKRRPHRAAWAENIARQCRGAGVSCFVKQMEVGAKVSGEMGRFPLELQVREYPDVSVK